MDLFQLTPKTRYLFCENNNGNIKWFRASFLGLHTFQQWTTMVCKYYESDDHPLTSNTVFHMHSHNIISGETLTNIFENYPCKLPDDVLNIINSFW